MVVAVVAAVGVVAGVVVVVVVERVVVDGGVGMDAVVMGAVVSPLQPASSVPSSQSSSPLQT